MPVDFPAWGRVYAFFRRWREHGLTAEFHDRLRGRVRERECRLAEPSAGIVDAQSVRAAATVPAASRGYDGGKKVPGRKRHIVTDTLGLLLTVAVTPANTGDREAAVDLLPRRARIPGSAIGPQTSAASSHVGSPRRGCTHTRSKAKRSRRVM
ncbi:transposase [Streptomyces sp. NPDC059874]|uniref:transposase n=1 Tax=Streptomyces sp. NPDC059874 TaxID=3346983 RepID=UPI003667EB9A